MREWLSGRLRNRRTWIIGAPVAIVVIGLLGPFVWFGVIKDDPPPPLSFADSPSATTTLPSATATSGEVTTTSGPTSEVGAATPKRPVPSAAPAANVSETDGPWRVGPGSIAGYRIKETVGVTSQDAVGRTQKVTGNIVVRGATLQSASFVVDMASVESDDDRRDSAYRDSMAVDQFPTSTFALAAPVTFSHVPNELEDIVAEVTGNLTLRGVTRTEKFSVKVRRIQGRIEVLGAIDVKFEDYKIPNPSNGYARTEDHGLVEFLLAFDRG